MKFKIDKTIVGLILVSLVGIAEAVLIGSIILTSFGDIRTVQSNIEAEDVRRARFDELVSRFSEIDEEGIIKEVEELLPSADNFLSVIREIEQLGKLSGSRLIVSLGKARLTTSGFELPNELRNRSVIGRTLPPDANYDFLEVEITVRGSYSQLAQFLNLFEQSEYYMNITSMNINRINANKRIFVDANLTVEIFVQQVVFK